ncbi:MAG: TatD family hydrolase [Bdellovibrionales bacterium]|nr:TatD family hydrolase [Bdellovibrionales bacterium]
MELIDTHCHLDALEHAPLESLLKDAIACDVRRMVCIGASGGEASAHRAVEFAEQFDFIWATVGIHPHDAGRVESLAGVRPLLEHPKVVAVGETGLDYYREWAPFDRQRALFSETIEVAKEVKKPLIIHCRDAAEDTYRMLKEQKAEAVGGVFHCYAEDAAFAAKLRDINFLVSFPGTLTFKSAHALRATAQAIPLDQIMLETDCPYMAPEPFRGKPSEPKHVYQIALKLAEVKELPIATIAEETTRTAERFFGISR